MVNLNEETFAVGDTVVVDSYGMWANQQRGIVVRANPDKDWRDGIGESYGDRQYTVQIGSRNFEANNYELWPVND